MACRRKTKKERELVADIRKLFGVFCNSHTTCLDCDYKDSRNCVKAYLSDLLDKEE